MCLTNIQPIIAAEMSIAVMIPHVILHIMSYYSVLFVSADIKAVETNRPFIIMCGFFFIFLLSLFNVNTI